MNRFSIVMAFVVGMWLAPAAQTAQAAPCLIVTLTGTQSGPPVFNGQAGAGTLVSYGDDDNNCSAMKLQFDTGRGTNMRLSQIGVSPGQLNAIFHAHAFRSYGGLRRRHAAALALQLEGAED